MKRWHDFEPGQQVRRDESVETLRRHISSGHVKNVEEKRRYLREIDAFPHGVIVFVTPVRARPTRRGLS